MFKSDLFKGHRILITGGGTGLGRGMGEKLMSLGADLVICGRREGVLKEAAVEMEDAHGQKVDVFPVDIRNAAAVDEMVQAAFDTGPVTGLINNAAGNFIARTKDLSPRGFDAIANIVMHGTFYVTHAVGRRWIERDQPGAVVSILVTWVRNGGPFVVPSAMSKAAVHAMTMSLAAEWGGHRIRLNAIAPGEIPTEGMNKRLSPGEKPGERTIRRNPMGRHGTMDELGNLAAFLLSDQCGWINGEMIALDGGQGLATGGNFYELRAWGDAEWQAAREAIEVTNARDRQAR